MIIRHTSLMFFEFIGWLIKTVSAFILKKIKIRKGGL